MWTITGCIPVMVTVPATDHEIRSGVNVCITRMYNVLLCPRVFSDVLHQSKMHWKQGTDAKMVLIPIDPVATFTAFARGVRPRLSAELLLAPELLKRHRHYHGIRSH